MAEWLILDTTLSMAADLESSGGGMLLESSALVSTVRRLNSGFSTALVCSAVMFFSTAHNCSSVPSNCAVGALSSDCSSIGVFSSTCSSLEVFSSPCPSIGVVSAGCLSGGVVLSSCSAVGVDEVSSLLKSSFFSSTMLSAISFGSLASSSSSSLLIRSVPLGLRNRSSPSSSLSSAVSLASSSLSSAFSLVLMLAVSLASSLSSIDSMLSMFSMRSLMSPLVS
mmetsp:Transcript_9662/g.14594  ORF Transcript_9662/g.14594 Transcript_9662/m.14594 type:complete len:224 (+) Transcript_9662:664-1335(+)